MKVLVHLNHGVDKSYVLNFGSKAAKGALACLVNSDNPDAAEAVFQYARVSGVKKIEVASSELKRVELEADFTFSQHGYVTERLA